jgi:hypothetical protein
MRIEPFGQPADDCVSRPGYQYFTHLTAWAPLCGPMFFAPMNALSERLLVSTMHAGGTATESSPPIYWLITTKHRGQTGEL